MTFAEAVTAACSGARVSRVSYWNAEREAYEMQLYVVEGEFRVDSGEQVGITNWVASADEQRATDWVVVAGEG